MAYLTVFLVGQYLYVETHYEHFHTKADRIYRVAHHAVGPGGYETHWARTYFDFINEIWADHRLDRVSTDPDQRAAPSR